MNANLLNSSAFLAAAQSGQQQEAAQAADVVLRYPQVDERTLAYAALTYLHAGRFEAAKQAAMRLESAPGVDALWAKAAVAVAFTPKKAEQAIDALAPYARGTNEFRLLAGVAAHQRRDIEQAAQLLDGVVVHPMSVFVTAASLGLRVASNSGALPRVTRVGFGIVGAVAFGIVGFILGIVGGEAFNRARAQRTLGPTERALLELKPPKETRNSREGAGIVLLGALLVMVLVGLIVLASIA